MTEAEPWSLPTLRAARADVVPRTRWELLVESIWDGASLRSVEPLIGGLGGLLDRVQALADGAAVSTVVRRFLPEWGEGAADVARSVATLEVLASHDVPGPRPMWSDGTGELLGRPALAMTDLPGSPVAAALDPGGAGLVGGLLARLHEVPGAAMAHRPEPGDLADQIARELEHSRARDEDFMDRGVLHTALEQAAERVTGQPETFLHDDFHPGNVLRHGTDAYVVDLPWATRGDPGRDLGYCRLDLALTSTAGTAEGFLAGYRAGGGVVPEHLWVYDLMGALRSLPTPADWLPAFHELGRTDLTADDFEQRARAFVTDALARGLSAGVLGTLGTDDVRAGSNG